MDLVTHVLITRKFIGTEGPIVLAGIMPDAPFYLTYPAWLIAQGRLRSSAAANDWPDPPTWMETLHHAFHSLPVACALSILFYARHRRWPARVMAAWCLHILIDIPTHSRRRWGPRFLWPLSTFAVDGVSWAELAFALVKRLRERNRATGLESGLYSD